MFHILAGKAEQLVAWPESEATKVLCDVNHPRCAISQKKFDNFVNSNKLRTDRVCSACYRRAMRNS